MKKYPIFIFYLALITLIACNGNKNGNTATHVEEAAEEESMTTAIFEINDTTRLVEHSQDSPTLIINISLPIIEANNPKATDNINQAIAYTLFESDDNSLSAACMQYVNSMKEIYTGQLPDYLNLGETNTPSPYFNNYCFINGEAKRGYKGALNYIMYIEEYSGGAHPYSYNTVLNFNPSTGEEILLDDIFKPGYEEELVKIIKETLEAEATDEESKAKIENTGDLYVSGNYILDKEQITFIYNKYDISYYAAGDIIVNVNYDKLKNLLK